MHINYYKKQLRKIYNQKRQKTTYSYKKFVSQQICRHIQSLKSYIAAQHLAIYYATRNEISLKSVFENATLQGKKCYFPIIQEQNTLKFIQTSFTTAWQKNQYGILEPDNSLQKDISNTYNILPNLEIIFLPLLAFDSKGNRLGMGQGYYDRTLKEFPNAILIGIGYEFQRHNHLPSDVWDVPLDAIITERGFSWSTK